MSSRSASPAAGAPVGLPQRPGVAQGAYPERADVPLPTLARAWHAARGALRPARRAGPSGVAAIAARVEREAAGLTALDDAGFERAVGALREVLRRSGLRDDLLPRGFALVREAAARSLGTPHYDVQLFGGWVMARRGLAELETGEGKTLTATLPAAVAALAGIPVHVITANDYLVERDAEAMGPLYARLGLTVGRVVEREPDPSVRRAAYACDVTYVTNKQVAFDYLRDRLAGAGARPLARLARGPRAAGAEVVLRGLCFAIVDEADSLLIDDARTPLILSRPAAGGADRAAIAAALELARSLAAVTHYRVDPRASEVELTAAGRDALAARSGAEALGGPRRREEWVQRALAAQHLFERDRHYLVQDGAIQIIDLPTGRRAPDRAFEGGLHALIEEKEGLAPTPPRETVARISYQSFFRRYLRLAGMTGTAREVARELWSVYGLRTVSVPTRLPSLRRDLGAQVLPSAAARWDRVVERIRALHAERRPVLVGTCSVESSEQLSVRLCAARIPHQVLSARQDREEAAVVARAGEAGRVTVATRMAGRGTDIRLGPGVAERGGLAVIATEPAEARRIDRQLFGRGARQGAPGSHEQIVSLEDRLPAAHLPGWLRGALARAGLWRLRFALTRAAQRAEERRSALARRRLLETERRLGELLAFSGRGES